MFLPRRPSHPPRQPKCGPGKLRIFYPILSRRLFCSNLSRRLVCRILSHMCGISAHVSGIMKCIDISQNSTKSTSIFPKSTSCLPR